MLAIVDWQLLVGIRPSSLTADAARPQLHLVAHIVTELIMSWIESEPGWKPRCVGSAYQQFLAAEVVDRREIGFPNRVTC